MPSWTLSVPSLTRPTEGDMETVDAERRRWHPHAEHGDE